MPADLIRHVGMWSQNNDLVENNKYELSVYSSHFGRLSNMAILALRG